MPSSIIIATSYYTISITSTAFTISQPPFHRLRESRYVSVAGVNVAEMPLGGLPAGRQLFTAAINSHLVYRHHGDCYHRRRHHRSVIGDWISDSSLLVIAINYYRAMSLTIYDVATDVTTTNMANMVTVNGRSYVRFYRQG